MAGSWHLLGRIRTDRTSCRVAHTQLAAIGELLPSPCLCLPAPATPPMQLRASIPRSLVRCRSTHTAGRRRPSPCWVGGAAAVAQQQLRTPVSTFGCVQYRAVHATTRFACRQLSFACMLPVTLGVGGAPETVCELVRTLSHVTYAVGLPSKDVHIYNAPALCLFVNSPTLLPYTLRRGLHHCLLQRHGARPSGGGEGHHPSRYGIRDSIYGLP